MVKRTLYRVFLVFSVLLSFTATLSAENAGIKDLLVSSNTEHVLVYARVTNCFTKEIEAAILAGVPTTFTFVVELYKERSYWLDSRIAQITVNHTIKYDNVKKLFLVLADGEKEIVAFPDFEGAKRAMTDLNGIQIVPLKTLEKNAYYYVRIKAKLDKVRLPFHLEYVFFFVSFWDFETDWYQQRFFY
jgi:hypothetical protein